ncbi:MAG: hypothetical protein A2901_01980 [Elusimicrobia bacterium RIFCSPLOWO2_01_FULL_54_10]|nr:MAG: hypothetical protein A2901_01980 [Elusimicrobia bacterium RIFCSPLOWO2_01_FULL_54_10]
MSGVKTLTHLKDILKKHVKAGKHPAYFVPSVWMDQNFEAPIEARKVNPHEFFLNAIESILSKSAEASVVNKGKNGDWSAGAIVYNLFVRLGTAFDHNQNGVLDLPLNRDDFRETGTFLKSIALLPYINALGANTIHLLPITTHGADGKKGNLGSNYAIRDPYELDEALSEDFYGFGVEKEFKAFMEAAHHMGMAVVLEFVFRTASKDSDWAAKHPDWFYWVKDSVTDRPSHSSDGNLYGSPVFSPEELKEILARQKSGNFENSIPPSQIYRNMFTASPPAKFVRKDGVRWVGQLPDGTKVRIPGAFADWPPDDSQPPWGDVTYLKFYDHPDFNYIAYNTVRMYDPVLAQKTNSKNSLWKEIEGIIPFYQEEYGIDGVMIDMGHALPKDLFSAMERRAREINPNFAFWEESFGPTKESRENGYNLSVGYFWCDVPVPDKLKALLDRCATEGLPLPFFGTVETHDTPRAAARGERDDSEFFWVLACLMPVVPYIHGGFELGEKVPVNTGLGFSAEEIKLYPPEKLSLFSATALNWLGSKPLLVMVRDMVRFRRANARAFSELGPETFKISQKGDEVELVREFQGERVRAIINMQKREIQLLEGRR